MNECQFCNRLCSYGIRTHEDKCFYNPKNIRRCPVCNNVLEKKGGTTCSHACSNTLFRSRENNPNWSNENYKIICFDHFEKKCVVCNEERVVEVHHYDGNHSNNDPNNLVPLCPTHHRYAHLKLYYLIKDKVDEYMKSRIRV